MADEKKGPLTVRRQSGRVLIDLPETLPDADCSVVAVELDGPPVVERETAETTDRTVR